MRNLILIIFAPVCMGLISCSTQEKPERKILLSTPLSGQKRKGQAISQSVKLFLNNNPNTGFKLELEDSRSENNLAASQVLGFLGRDGDNLLFGPPGTEPSQALLDQLNSASRSKMRNGAFLLNQVTASHDLDRSVPVVSSFFAESDYLRGVVPFLVANQGRNPPRAHIIRLGSPGYFSEVARYLRADLKLAQIPIGMDFILDPTAPEELKNKWRSQKIKTEDWVFLLTYGEAHPFRSLHDDPVFKSVLKVNTYGNLETVPADQEWFFNNSWNASFWHRSLLYKGSSGFTNCQFVEAFQAEFGTLPDFHAAFTYSILQAMQGIQFKSPFQLAGPLSLPPLPSITGSIEWSPAGTRLEILPILAHWKQRKRMVYLPPDVEGVCPGMGAPNSSYRHWGTDIVSPKKAAKQTRSANAGQRYLPVELWSGAPWDGREVVGNPKSNLVFGNRLEKRIIGPFQWRHPKLGTEMPVYRRFQAEENKVQLFSVNEFGLGRVFDSREGGFFAWNEVKFPTGLWREGEVRSYQHQRWRNNSDSPEAFTSKITILKINFSFQGRQNSLEYELEIRDSHGFKVSHFKYIYSPELGCVKVTNLLAEKK